VLKNVAMLLCLAFAASAFAQGSPESADASTGMKLLRTNDKGYGEYLWLKDSSVVIKIPAGKFTMGSPKGEGKDSEQPQHDVYIGEFYMDKFEVTNRQYKRFCDATGRSYPLDTGFANGFVGMPSYFTAYPNYPVLKVSWTDAQAYATWAGKCLPTEAEWEKAARGTDGRKYPWGASEPDAGGIYRASYAPDSSAEDGYRFTAPVGSFPAGASPYGCLDMAGNVWEWCNDWYDPSYYGRSATNNPQGPSDESMKATSVSIRVMRGGGWGNEVVYLRCAYRFGGEPAGRYWFCGFRCAQRP
jgi:formylglycine-generating enzyme required for sulfatase activity